MYNLYHYTLCPFSRQVRVVMEEKDIKCFFKNEQFWTKRKDFLRINPFGTVPVLVSTSRMVLSQSAAIIEYLEETYDKSPLLQGSSEDRSKIRKIVHIFNDLFFKDCAEIILYERIFNALRDENFSPNQRNLKLARDNMVFYMSYIQSLLSKNQWIATSEFSIADICVGSFMSSLDYLGEIDWKDYPIAKDWYAVLKSRPSFRGILEDTVFGFRPSTTYKDLDF